MSKGLQKEFDAIEGLVQEFKIAHYKSMDGSKKGGKQARKAVTVLKKLTKNYKAASLAHDDAIDKKKGNKTRSEKRAEKVAKKEGKTSTKKEGKTSTKKEGKTSTKKVTKKKSAKKAD